eukprot:TRINITY_DN2709_c0_g1_i1.p1 TRINITY_DN2709_c0_g1~~TRINITY_DN2709_c0_g1_i1.p1  ORF type:complete len:155 (-),score=44.58 TRINITY_DN2709_c0_g1_i1:361-825(-)
MPKPENLSPYVEYGAKEKKYRWTQSEEEAVLTIPVPEGTRAKDVIGEISTHHIKFGLNGKKKMLVEGNLHETCVAEDSTWTIEKGEIEVTLAKAKKGWWKGIVVGHKEINPEQIEGSKYIDEGLLARIYHERKAKEAEEAALNPQPEEPESDDE